MKLKRTGILLLALSVVSSACAQDKTLESKDENQSSILGTLVPSPSKDRILGEILKGVLENYHITKKKLDDSVSKNALDLYIERVDYGKQFLLRKDVNELTKYKNDLDNEVSDGNLKLVNVTSKIMKERLPVIEKYVDSILKKEFNYKKAETLETDSKKRKFVGSIAELKERWRKIVKYEVLAQYLDLVDEQNGVDSSKDKKKKEKKEKKAKHEKKLSEKELRTSAREKVAKRYNRVFKRLNEEKRSDQLDKFYNSVAKVYDPHTHYFVPEEKEDFDIEMSGKLEGIGALLREEGSYIKVERIIPGSASWKGKELKAEDIILGVSQDNKEFVDIVDMGIRDAVKLIRGKKDTPVYLRVKKPEGVTSVIKIIRDKVVLEESYAKGSMLESKKHGLKVGYINVPKFYRDFQDSKGRNSSDDVKAELVKLNKTDAKAVILDLRNNGGGALVDATLMGGLFIDKGPIVQVKKTGAPDVKYDVDGKVYWDKPLIVLINRFSASASEIVAGAMKDYDRAVIIGSSEQTHGKGTVQVILGLNDFLASPIISQKIGDIGAIKVTSDMFYRINGMSTQFRGVTPHIELPDQYGFLDSGEKSLDYAIPYAEVDPVEFKPWKKNKFKIDALKKNSAKRVKESKVFKQITESVNWSKERKEQTERSLTLSDMKKFRDEAQEVGDKYDKLIEEAHGEKAIEDLSVSSLSKLKTKAAKESFEEVEEGLQKDPVIEEAMNVVQDMIKA